MAFHGLSPGAAQKLMVGDFGSALAGAAANPAASIASDGRVVRYLGDYRAIVRTAHGFELKTSTAPLRVASGGGLQRPVDLGLTSSGGGFAPVRPLTAVSIARSSADGVAVGPDGLRVALEGDDVSGNAIDGESVFFGGVDPDVDAVVSPTLDGAELFAVLRSRLSPQQLRYRVTLPAGAVLLSAADGGAVISRSGVALASVPAPTARDAQGVEVPVRMSVAGDELVLSVEHRKLELAYPVLVDPLIEITITGGAGWKFSQIGVGNVTGSNSESGLSISVPEETYPVYEGERLIEASGGKWEYTPPSSPELRAVEFDGTSFSGSSMEGSEPVEGVDWELVACDGAFGGVINYSPPPEPVIKFTGSREGASHCESPISVSLSDGGYGTTDSGTVSVSAVVVTANWPAPKSLPEEGFREGLGEENQSKPYDKPCLIGDPVNCATGNQTDSQTDLTVGGRGPGLQLTRAYNSQQAAKQTEPGAFGYGWTGPYSAHIAFGKVCETCSTELATVYQDNGSATYFEDVSGKWVPAAPLVQSTFVKEGTGYVYTLPDQSKLEFNGSGQLTSEVDRNGNTITLSYNSKGQLEAVTDGAGRKLTFAYTSGGQVESARDPMGHTVKYTYEGGNLVSVTQPGESSLRWRFKYNSSHELTETTDGRGNTTSLEYNSAHQVVAETDPLKRKRAWKYGTLTEGTYTEITEPNSAVTREEFNEQGLPTSVTHAYGTSLAATTSYKYNGYYELTSVTDPNKHTTKYSYDLAGNRISETDPDGDEKKWTYDSTHDIETETTPAGETTTIKRNGHGDPEVIERPAPGATAQKTTYKYDSDGDVESMTNPLERTCKYEYDSYGDRKAEVDPEGNKRTWEYNEDSQETATVSPRGNVAGGEPSKYTTKTERDAQGRPVTVTDPLGHTTKYVYDGDGDLETMTDGNGHTTKYTYNADDEPTKVEASNKDVTEAEYDSMGQVKSQTDGNKHTTKYERNLLEEVTEEINPKERKTVKEYDAAGNLVKVTDPEKRATTYTYDPTNRLTETSYSSGSPATVKYEYNKDGDRTKMVDGTGTTKYAYDQLDRLTETENGHKEVVKYEYNLANAPTKITYPNGKAVTRAYDKDDRLEKVTDWLGNSTRFAYNADSELGRTTFPTATEDMDKYEYNQDDQMSSQKLTHGSETLASYGYGHDGDDQVNTITNHNGETGEERVGYEYDPDSRLTKIAGTVVYEYDAANNPTKIGSNTYKYASADELESGGGVTYAYNEVGQRTKATPEKGPATTYGYDQAGNLISVERPKEGEVAKIEDAYAYNGEGLRTSQTISGTTSYFAWDTGEGVPLILGDGTNSYIYGADNLPVEQINNSTGAVTYLHHDQQGSTRLITGETGKVEGKCSYSTYGVPDCEGTATTPLGFDGQYTSPDTGLIYMRAREYDPATGQFLSRDPLEALTGEPYTYANDNPINEADPTGLGFFGELEELGEEAGEGIAGFGDKLTFGLTKKVREAIGDENVDTCSAGYQAGGYAGLATGALIPGEDDVDAAELGAEGVDEVGNTVTSTTRATPGGDGAESVIIKERGPNGETLQVVHQVGKPLPGGGTIVIHQHAKYGPLPGSELFFPDVEP